MIQQAQHPLGDDVEVDLAGAALDGVGLGPQHGAQGADLTGGEAVAFPAQALQAERLDGQFGALLVQLGGGVFDDRGGGAGALAGLGFDLGATDGQLEGGRVHLVGGDAGAQVGIGDPAFGVHPDMVLRRVDHVDAGPAAEAAGGDVLALVLQQTLGDFPAAVANS